MLEIVSHERITELRLNRPPVNALSPDLLTFLADEVHRSSDQGARAVVLSGREGMFSAGLDVPLLVELDEKELARALEAFFNAIEALVSSPVEDMR